MKPPVEQPASRQILPVGIDAEILQRAFELQSAAARIARRAAGHFDRGIVRNQRARLCPRADR